jgi:uncharacterized OB-fold protein
MTGVVYACTTLHRAFPGHTVPFTVAWIDLPDGARVLAKSSAGTDEGVRPGDQVTLAHDVELDVQTFDRVSR